MSKLRKRILQLHKVKRELKEKKPQSISTDSYLTLLQFHLELLKEVDKLADGIKMGDSAAVDAFIQKRVKE